MSDTEGFNAGDRNPPREQLSSLLEHYQSGFFNKAENLAISLIKEFPKDPFGWKVLAVFLRNKGRKIDALRVKR